MALNLSKIRARIFPRRVSSKYGSWLQWHYVIYQGNKVLVYDDCRDRQKAHTDAANRVAAYRIVASAGHKFRGYEELIEETSN